MTQYLYFKFHSLIFQVLEVMIPPSLLLLQRILGFWGWPRDRSDLAFWLYFGYMSWTIFDIFDLKKSNALMLESPKSAMGFGQLLPLLLQLNILLSIFDGFFSMHII